MITSNDGGGCVSVNGGKSWTDEDFCTTQFYHVTTTNHVPYHVAGAQQDNSTIADAERWMGSYECTWANGDTMLVVERVDI
jgi:hypothetical protein